MTAHPPTPARVPRHAPRASAEPPIVPGGAPWRQRVAPGGTGAWRRLPQRVGAVVLFLLGLASFSMPVQAQLIRPFTPRFTANAPGDIYIIGNTLLSCVPVPPGQPLERPDDDDDPRDTCDPDIPQFGSGSVKDEDGRIIPASGSFLSDQGYDMQPVNQATPQGVRNSSSAEWRLPNGATVLWAGLYWSARKDDPDPTVRLATPRSGGYLPKTGVLGPDQGSNDIYQNFVEVTAEVRAGGSGLYRVADVDAQTGKDFIGFYAGWALVIVIQDPSEPLRNLIVFDGLASVADSDGVAVPVSGFLTPLSGPVSTRIGVVGYEGDLGASGDAVRLDGVLLGDAVTPTDNFFNGTISRRGRTPRNSQPSFVNQLGFDIKVLDAVRPDGSSILGNGASSAIFEFVSSSGGEIYSPGVFTFITELFQPFLPTAKVVQDLNGGQVLPGDILEYTLTLVNAGTDAAINVVLTDPIPTGATYVPGSLRITDGANAGALTDAGGDDVGDFTGTSVVYRLGTGATATTGGKLAIGESATVVFRVQIEATAAPDSVISNQGVVDYNGETVPDLALSGKSDSDATEGGDQPTDIIVGQERANLRLRKIALPRTVQAGQQVTYAIAALNAGPGTAVDVELRDTTPPNTTFLSAIAPAGWTVATTPPPGGTGAVVFTRSSLPPLSSDFRSVLSDVPTVSFASPLFTIVVQVNAGVPGGTEISNVATLTSPTDPLPRFSTAAVGVLGSADLSITKTDGQTSTEPGATVTYTVVVTNNGPDPVTGAVVTDPVPAALVGVTWTCIASRGSTCPRSNTEGFSVPVNLLAGGTATFTVSGVVDPDATGTLVNQATITPPPGTIDPDNSNNTATDTTEIIPPPITSSADLSMVKTDNLSSTVPGAVVQYTLVVRNHGPDDVQGAAVIDPVPNTLTDVTWLCRASPGSRCPDPASGTGRIAVRVDLLSGGIALFRIRGTVAATASGSLRNGAAALPPPGTQDPVPSNNAAIDTDTITPPGPPSADLTMTKTDNVTQVEPGGLLLYTLVVTNNGPSAVTGARVVDPVPATLTGVTWTCTASPGSSCPASGTGAIAVPVDLLVGGTATFAILATVDPAASGTLVNQAMVTPPPDTPDPDPSNNTSTDSTEIVPGVVTGTADLTIVKTDSVSSTVPGATVQYFLVVRNHGPDAVQGATVIDPVPETLTEVIWLCRASPGSRCLEPASGTGRVVARVDLLAGGIALIRVRGTVAAPAGSTLRNLAVVLPPPGTRDPTPGNNVVIDTDQVLPGPGPGPAALNPPVGRKTVQTTDLPDLAWRVVWLNNANATPLLVRLLEPIPAATTYVDASVSCAAQGLSFVEQCAFDAATNQVVVDAILGADLGATSEEQAANEVVITFRTAVAPGVTAVTNQALAHWDATDTGSVDDDIDGGQVPVETGTAFGQDDPTVVPLPGLACLFQQRLLGLTPVPPTAGPGDGGGGGDGGTGGDAPADAGGTRAEAAGVPTVFTLRTPLDDERIAGTAVTLAARHLPVAGTTVSQATEVTIANGAAPSTLDIVEDTQRKTQQVTPQVDQVVISGAGVVVDLPASALPATARLQLDRVDPAGAPAPLPGTAVAPLVALTLTSGQTTFSSPVTLRLPYPDAELDGIVDDTSPALAALALTVWRFDPAGSRWVPLPEARVFPAVHEVQVATTQTGLYGVFQADDGRTGLAGTTAPAPPAPLSAGAQGSGWQDIGVVTTVPFLVPLDTTTLLNGTYAFRAICATDPAALSTVAGSAPTTSTVLQTGGGGGCSLQPGRVGTRTTVLTALGNLGMPLVVLLLLGLWRWRRPR